jgi:hypothetical protein
MWEHCTVLLAVRFLDVTKFATQTPIFHYIYRFRVNSLFQWFDNFFRAYFGIESSKQNFHVIYIYIYIYIGDVLNICYNSRRNRPHQFYHVMNVQNNGITPATS